MPKPEPTHTLKIWPQHFAAVTHPDPLRRKSVELRRNDRDYRVGDILRLMEWDPASEQYTSDFCDRVVTHIVDDYEGLAEGFVALSIAEVDDGAPAEARPPEHYIKEELNSRGWTVDDFARAAHIGRLRAPVIINCVTLTPAMAEHVARAFGTSVEYWLGLERAWQDYLWRKDGGSDE